jgi:hypothetical protein
MLHICLLLTRWVVVAQLGGVVGRVTATLVVAARQEPHLPGDGEEVVAAVHVIREEMRRRSGRARQRW